MVDRISFVAVIILIFSIPLYYIYGIDFIIPYATLLAVVVALFREKLLNYLFYPVLKISLADPPDHYAIVEIVNPATGEVVGNHLSISVFVENVGKTNAENVELYFTGLESNVIKSFERYKSIPLLRSWAGGATRVNSLPRNTPIRFSIGYIDFNNAKKFNFEFFMTPTALKDIDCKCQAYRPNEPTKYPTTIKFEVKAICDNAKISETVIGIKYNCNWCDGIKISLL